MSNGLISVVIVTSGHEDHLRSLLASVRQQTYPYREILVIDNSCDPGFAFRLKECYGEVEVYSAEKNLFYCGALNKGIAMSKGAFVLCLNDDVVLDARFLEEALKGFEADGRVGMVSGKILRSDGKTLDSTGLFLTHWRAPCERGYGRPDTGQFESEGYVFGVNGAVAFYRRAMLEEVKLATGYFDPRFRIFYEDLDLAWRAHNRGWRGYYVPRALAYHARGLTVRKRGSTGRPWARRYLSDDLYLCLLRNRYLTLARNASASDIFLHLPFIAAYEAAVWAYTLIFRPRAIAVFLAQTFRFSRR